MSTFDGHRCYPFTAELYEVYRLPFLALAIEIAHYLVNTVTVQFDLQFGTLLLVTVDKAVHFSP